MTVTIWHNPRCSKSRQTLQLLQDRGVDPEIRKYLEDVPDARALREVLVMLDIPAIELVRTKEADFKAAGLSRDSTDEELISAMTAHPKLIERPVVIANGRAALGRPPEQVLEIL